MTSLSESTTISNDDAPVQPNGLDEPDTFPSESCHPATTSSLKRCNTDEGCSGAKRQEQAFPSFETFSEYHAYGDNIPVGYSSWEERNTQEHTYAETMPFDSDGNYSPPYARSELLELCANNPCAGREDCEETDGSFFGRAMIFHSLTGGNPEAYSGEQDIFIPHGASSHDGAPTKDGDILSNNKPSDDDEYSITSSHEEAMKELLDSSPDHLAQIPPSSVIRAVEGSSTPEKVDPSLQISPPGNGPKMCSVLEGNTQPCNTENLVDEDIDWIEVVQHLPAAPKIPNTADSTQPLNSTSQLLENAVEWMQSRSISPAKYRPFTRPDFPCPLRNKSPVEGISNSNVLRTCFRVGSIFKEVARWLRADQEVTFELFARASYTSREKASRIQHFQFVDLYEDQLPHISGVLTGWKNDSALEKESAMFLDDSMNKMCRCMCRPRKATESDTGWDLKVLHIRATSWHEIESVRSVVCYQ